MLQALLADRFALKIHRATKELPIYVLTVVDAGNRIRRAIPAEVHPIVERLGDGGFIDNLAFSLTNTVGRMVVNQTGLTGGYDFTLEWAPEGADASDPRPSIYPALEEQMGLKLKPAQGPVDTIVVDSIERPSAN